MKRRKPLKRSQKPLKRSWIKKRRKRTPLAIIKDKLWELCKEYCRKKWPNICYTCGAENLVGSNCHTGHCIPSVLCPFELDYSPLNLRNQCMRCNIHCGGNAAEFERRFVAEYGYEYLDKLYLMKNQPTIVKPTIHDYETMIDWYKQLIEEL